DSRQRGRKVVLLPRGEAEENKNDDGPQEEQQQHSLGRRSAILRVQEAQAHPAQRLRQENTPRQQPDQDHSPEQRERKGTVVDRIALAEVAKEMLVYEVKPEKALGLAGGRVAHRGQPVPRY